MLFDDDINMDGDTMTVHTVYIYIYIHTQIYTSIYIYIFDIHDNCNYSNVSGIIGLYSRSSLKKGMR